MERALVLGGGGVTGVAWELGLLAGLAERGVALSGADLVVGTSAGSVVGAQVCSGAPVEQLYEAQLAPPTSEVAARLGWSVLARLAWAGGRTRDAARARARIGAMAVAARTPSEASRRAVIEARLLAREWPQRLRVTAVDAASGEFVVFDGDSGVSLVDAVGASCAVPGVWPPVTIGARRFVDGGMRSAVNADLAAGARRVVVLAPTTAAFGPMPRLSAQVAQLRADGARVAVVAPDAAARAAIGRNVLDPARRAGAARAGRAQAAVVVDEVAALWA
ncbi:patatin-like phospholipase family protein [Micromonospora sp. CPCC 205539]|uniref:patatin-like phospholipase family protein n=1 Tax=Micromonospora sp. CPCC 205539 TaxID=3122408 RepID=UPI002FF3AE95